MGRLPVTRENPKDLHEVHQHEIFDRPIANPQAQVMVSKKHSLTKGFVSKVMSVKSLIPGGHRTGNTVYLKKSSSMNHTKAALRFQKNQELLKTDPSHSRLLSTYSLE